ncbi:MAG: polysaccharide biosynthesis protein [Spirochaetes bacterium]|nr:polysaccharide biosynthesis protein [Spirochaetota bacterium]
MKFIYPVRGKKFLYLFTDIILIAIAFLASYFIRFYPETRHYLHLIDLEYFFVLVSSFIISFYLLQIYRIMWAYSNINDIYKLITANLFGFLLYSFLIFFARLEYSRIIVILSFLFISISTILYRILIRDYVLKKNLTSGKYEKINKEKNDYRRRKILIIGAGEAGRTFLSEYIKMGMAKSIVGFIDDDKYKVGKIFNGKMIYATSKDVNAVINKYNINEILIAMPSASSATINKIVSLIKRYNHAIPIKILPSVSELFKDQPLTTSVRDISIADLIGRDEFRIDECKIKEKFKEKTILITGAGGSIGSEICKQILKFDVNKIVAIGRGENSIYQLIKTMNEFTEFLSPKIEIVYKIIDIKDYELLEMAFSKYNPDIVFHTAAHKHVPLMEFNEVEAIQNNIGGTLNVLKCSSKFKVDEFVLISTDKAVHPVNIMGATKRLTEIITDYYNRNKSLKTSIVRFGNVLGSRGSVIPLFREQIEKGGPVTVTHPDITRYFMSIPEASLLVINAAAYSNKGEYFILDMGNQYKVLDIARRLIELYGYKPDEDIKITFTGLRPGEKMYEELSYKSENLKSTDNDKIFKLNNPDNFIDQSLIEKFLHKELPIINSLDSKEIRIILKELIPEYNYADLLPHEEAHSRMVI